MWVHIEMNFKIPNHLSSLNHNKLLNLIRYIVMDIKPKRKFWLFEPYPDFFLAMEISKWEALNLAHGIKYYKSISPKFIKKLWLVKNSKDEPNGEKFLNILNAYADSVLNKGKFEYGHISHCILNQFGLSRKEEAGLYYRLCKERLDYGTKRSNRKKTLHKRVR